MSAVPRLLLVCGSVLAGTAATVGVAFFGVRTWLTWLPLVGGVSALAVGAALAFLQRRRAGGSAFTSARARLMVEIGLVIAVACALNAVALQFPATVDVTTTGRNTLADASVAVARGIREPVVVTARLDAADPTYADLAQLVERYRAHAPSLALVRDAPVAGAGDATVVVSAAERRQRVRYVAGAPDREEQLTNALRAVTLKERARVYVLAGPGASAVSDEGALGMRRAAQALVDEGLEVVPLPLVAVGKVPEDAALVIVAATRALAAEEIAALGAYVDGGGRALVMLEPREDAGLSSVLGGVGVQANDDLVADPSPLASVLGGGDAATGVAYAAHPVTAKLGGALTHFPRARSLSVNPGTPAEVTPLVQTGAEAYGETSMGAPAKDDVDLPGPLTLALAVTAERTKLVVVGDASFATNQAVGLGANLDLFVNAALWLADKGDAIAIRPRGRGGNLLLLTPTSRERIAFTLLYGLPVLLLCAGLAVSALRRRR